MYAIVDIAGQQLKVEKDQKIFVNRLDGAEGSKVSFEKVLLLDNDGKVQVGTPVVENCVVSATIVSHVKGDKVLVFKKKRRKGYQKLNGHRQQLTQLLIDAIGEEKKAPKKEAAKEDTKVTAKEVQETKEVKTETKAAPAAKKAAPKTEAKAAPKTAAKKAPAAKKEAPKKAAAKSTKETPAAKAPKKSASGDKSKE